MAGEVIKEPQISDGQQAHNYQGEAADIPSETIPIFHSLQYPQERKRFRDIKPISESFAPPTISSQGITLRDLIAKINQVEVLHLEKGNMPQ